MGQLYQQKITPSKTKTTSLLTNFLFSVKTRQRIEMAGPSFTNLDLCTHSSVFPSGDQTWTQCEATASSRTILDFGQLNMRSGQRSSLRRKKHTKHREGKSLTHQHRLVYIHWHICPYWRPAWDSVEIENVRLNNPRMCPAHLSSSPP